MGSKHLRRNALKIRDLIPPILHPDFYKKEPPVYASYGQAASACRGYGYEEESLVNVVYEKTRRYRDLLSEQKPFQLSPTNIQAGLVLTLSTQSDELRVIDFGAHVAHTISLQDHFYQIRSCSDGT